MPGHGAEGSGRKGRLQGPTRLKEKPKGKVSTAEGKAQGNANEGKMLMSKGAMWEHRQAVVKGYKRNKATSENQSGKGGCTGMFRNCGCGMKKCGGVCV